MGIAINGLALTPFKFQLSGYMMYHEAAVYGLPIIGHAYDPALSDSLLNLAYFLLKRSTLPAESTSFCLPVKKGWHLEQISTFISLTVEPDSNSFPQAQCTIVL